MFAIDGIPRRQSRPENTGGRINPGNGGIAVDGFSQTSVPEHYAIGDAPSRQLTPSRSAKASVCRYGVRQASGSVDHTNIPTAVGSRSLSRHVGLTEAQARAQISHVDSNKTDFRPIKSTMSGRDTRI